MSLLELFCQIDDFCQDFEKQWHTGFMTSLLAGNNTRLDKKFGSNFRIGVAMCHQCRYFLLALGQAIVKVQDILDWRKIFVLAQQIIECYLCLWLGM